MTPAEEKRELAKANNGQPVFWRAGAWEFGLSYGLPTKPPTEEEFEGGRMLLGKRMTRELPKTYEAFLAEWDAEIEEQRQERGRKWLFSAMLYPQGRASTEKEWDVLGWWTAAVGIPDPMACALTPLETTHPNAIHYWQWEET